MAKKRRLSLFRGDKSLWIIITMLCIVSMLVVYSATASMAYREVAGDTSHYLFRQFRFIILGFFIILVVHWIDYKSYAKYAKVLFNISIILVVLAYFIGVNLNEANRWIKIPLIGLTFQPSDMLKITLAMVLAQQLGSRQAIIDRIPILPSLSYRSWQRAPHKNIDIFIKTTKPLILPIVLSCAVVLPSNLSTSMIIFGVSMIILLTGRVKPSEIIKLITVAIFALIITISVMKLMNVGRANVWTDRMMSFVTEIFDDEQANKTVSTKTYGDNFQKEQAKIAIASGGLIGKGPGNSTQRSQLPHPYSDFAYAFIIEEYGLFGGIVVFILYLWIFFRAGVIVKKCHRPSSALLVLGLALNITSQAFVNMCVSVGLMPVTGQTLPLISLGGSSVFFTCIAFGMILGVSRENDEYENKIAEENRRLANMQDQMDDDQQDMTDNFEEEDYDYDDDNFASEESIDSEYDEPKGTNDGYDGQNEDLDYHEKHLKNINKTPSSSIENNYIYGSLEIDDRKKPNNYTDNSRILNQNKPYRSTMNVDDNSDEMTIVDKSNGNMEISNKPDSRVSISLYDED